MAAAARIDWVDYAKGFCIIFVVMMHSTLGVGQAVGSEGWLHTVVAFAKPFRMPDFFLISGLFLAQVIDRDWRTYLDRKVVHFVYFYLLWTAHPVRREGARLVVSDTASPAWSGSILETFWEPFGTLWFIYLLPIFFVVTKLAHGLRIPLLAIWLVAAALEIAPIHTGWTVIDEFASRFVYFYTGYMLAPRIFALAARCRPARDGARRPGRLGRRQRRPGVQRLRRASVRVARTRPGRRRRGGGGLGAAGQEPPVRAAALLRAELDRHLSRVFPRMAASRTVLVKYGGITDVGTVSVLVTMWASSARCSSTGWSATRRCASCSSGRLVVARAEDAARLDAAARALGRGTSDRISIPFRT